MDQHLIVIRLKSFFWSALAILIGAVAIAVVSPEMKAIIMESSGGGVVGTMAVLMLPEIAKHLRNLAVIKKAKKLGAIGGEARTFDLL